MCVFWIDMPVCDEHFTILRLWRNKKKSWVEFRGDAYNQWTHWENLKSAAQRLHDSLEGWHACVLHAGDKVAILPCHPDYEVVRRFYIEN